MKSKRILWHLSPQVVFDAKTGCDLEAIACTCDRNKHFKNTTKKRHEKPIYFQRHKKVHIWRKVLTRQRWMKKSERTGWRKLRFEEKFFLSFLRNCFPHLITLNCLGGGVSLPGWEASIWCLAASRMSWSANKTGNLGLDLSLLSSFSLNW